VCVLCAVVLVMKPSTGSNVLDGGEERWRINGDEHLSDSVSLGVGVSDWKQGLRITFGLLKS
jgi:hypothetical protein